MKYVRLFVSGILLVFSALSAAAQDKPNIVLIFMDNYGWGEPGFNGGGVIRGAATPAMDALAAEGLVDPGETTNVLFPNSWVPVVVLPQLGRHAASLRAFPRIHPGTPDPYNLPKNSQ